MYQMHKKHGSRKINKMTKKKQRDSNQKPTDWEPRLTVMWLRLTEFKIPTRVPPSVFCRSFFMNSSRSYSSNSSRDSCRIFHWVSESILSKIHSGIHPGGSPGIPSRIPLGVHSGIILRVHSGICLGVLAGSPPNISQEFVQEFLHVVLQELLQEIH